MIRPLLFIKYILFNKLQSYSIISTCYSARKFLAIQSFDRYLIEVHHDNAGPLNASMLLICARLCPNKTEKIVFVLESFLTMPQQSGK